MSISEEQNVETLELCQISTIVRRHVWILDDGSKHCVDSYSIEDAINVLMQIHEYCHQLIEDQTRFGQSEERLDALSLKVLGCAFSDISPSFISIPENRLYDYFYNKSLVIMSAPASFGFQQQ